MFCDNMTSLTDAQMWEKLKAWHSKDALDSWSPLLDPEWIGHSGRVA